MIKSFSGIILIVLGFRSAMSQDIPVDHYMGRPIISIPLTVISDRGLSFPVNLSYDATGVKVNSSHGWVGQNWSISTGEVRRELHGLPDDYYQSGDTRQGWLLNSNAGTIGGHTFPTDGTALACSTAASSEFAFINGLADQDTEPDVFQFSAPGLGGSFVFDNTGSLTGIKLIPYQDVQVVAHRATSTSPIDKFEIITSNGTKYTFDTPESSTRVASKEYNAKVPRYFKRDYLQYNKMLAYTSAWKLSSVQSASGEKIVLHYANDLYNVGSQIKYALTGTTDSAVPTQLLSYTISEPRSGYLLYSITSPHQTVNFISAGTGLDAMLTRIEINEVKPDETSFVRGVLFGYVSIESSVDLGYSRTFLSQLTMTNNCQAYQPYKFEYDMDLTSGRMALPAEGSPSQDVWGYYISSTLTHGYPKLYIYPSQTGINKISLYHKSGMSDEIVIPGVTRTGYTSVVGNLTGIQYPSGAKALLSYESNQFYNPIINDYSYGGGLRVSYIQTMDGISMLNNINKTYEYKKPDNSCSGKLLTLPTFWQVSSCSEDADRVVTPWSGLSSLSTEDQWKKTVIRTENNLNEDADALSPVVYEYVTEINGTNQGKILYQFDTIPSVFGASSTGDWNPTYVHVARASFHSTCAPAGLNVTSFYQHPFLPQTTYDWARGLLRKTSVYKHGDSNPEKEITNIYTVRSISSSAVKGMKYEYMPYDTINNGYFMYGAYSLVTNKLKVLARTTEKTKSKTSSAYLETITDYTYGSDHALLARTTSTNSEGAQIINQFRYVKDYGAPQATNMGTDLQVRMLDALYANGQTGIVVEQTSALKPSGGSEKTLGGQLVLFDNFGITQPVIRPKENYSLVTSGITSFGLSSVTGSGTSRVFNKNTSYRKKSTSQFSTLGDPVKIEGEQRQYQTFHADSLTGLVAASIKNAEAQEVIYSNFDQRTPYNFDLTTSFTVFDKAVLNGRSGFCLGGFKSSTASTKYLKKTLTKKPGVKYIFSMWYMAPGTTSTHSFDVIIRNTGGTQLLSQTITFTVTTAGEWYYGESVLDLASISDATVNVEVKFSGTFNPILQTAKVDEVAFRPVGTDIVLNAYNTAYGLLLVTPPDGRLIENERTPAGQTKYMRDADRNIMQAVRSETYVASGLPAAQITFTFDDLIYDDDPTYFRAFTACLDVTTIQWKKTPASNPTGGSFRSGAEVDTLDFSSTGDWLVTLKVSHSSYGSYEVTRTVNVTVRPLVVEICVSDGAVLVDLCAGTTVTETESCSGTFSTASFYNTTFSASVVSGCSGGTYSYAWEWRPYGDPEGYWSSMSGSGSTATRTNLSSYEVRCKVYNATCGRSGTSNTKAVLVYKSNPSCSDPIAP